MRPAPICHDGSERAVQVELRDGSRVRIRQCRRTDRDLLVRGFERLSPESRYRRFLTPMHELDARTLRYMTDVDHHDHEAMVALDKSGEGVGDARYVRDNAQPDTAEVAVTVVDGWQGRGLGTLLLEAISARARRGRPHLHGFDAGQQPRDDGPVRAPRAGPDRRARRGNGRDRGCHPPGLSG
jgi:GNAT superfamily N-acetyltransferase